MIILDEHVPPSQRHLLHRWHVTAHQIGHDIGRKGMQDDEIIPFLRGLRHPTFFTLDAGFYKREFCHGKYCLAYLSVKQIEVAAFVRRFLRQSKFDSQVKRMGNVIRLSHPSLMVWQLHAEREEIFEWDEK